MQRRCFTWFRAGFYFCDGIRSPSQNRHKLSLNRTIIQLKQGYIFLYRHKENIDVTELT